MTPVDTAISGNFQITIYVEESPEFPDWAENDPEIVNMWNNGEVYCFKIHELCECCEAYTKLVDSCCGLYGLESAKEEAVRSIPKSAAD